MVYPFTHSDTEFIIKAINDGRQFIVKAYFINGNRANNDVICISNTDSWGLEFYTGMKGLDAAITVARERIEQGHYFGSPIYESDFYSLFTTPEGIQVMVRRVDELTYDFELLLADGTRADFTWSSSNKRETDTGSGGPLTHAYNEVLLHFWALEKYLAD